MYLQQVRLQNVKCFEEVSLIFQKKQRIGAYSGGVGFTPR